MTDDFGDVPQGLDEVCIATIMRDVLKALDYVHRQGGIHRDIKVGCTLVIQCVVANCGWAGVDDRMLSSA